MLRLIARKIRNKCIFSSGQKYFVPGFCSP